MNTEIAFLEHASDRIGESDIVWASGSTIITTNTAVRIDHDDPVFPLIGSSYRAYRITDRALTMVAQPR
jgi:hypothetical protein